MSQEIIVKFTELLKEGVEEYSEVKDFISDEVLENEALELLGDCSKLAKILVKTKKIKDKMIFKSFLKGFYIGEESEHEKIEKLKEYVNDEDKAMFISETLENILNSKSKYASLILGYMINSLILNKKDLNPKYIMLADSLTHMFDHDIKNIRFIGDYCNYKIYDDRKKGQRNVKRNVYFGIKFKEILEENSYDKNIMYLTLEKCITYQLMIKIVDSTTELDLDGIDIDYDKESDDKPEISTGTATASTEVDESYEMTVVGDLLFEIINILDIN